MTNAYWQELGIAQTEDTVAIRRAYAVRLKTTRPEDDPEGFKRLRAAYEAALSAAERKAKKKPSDLQPANQEVPKPTLQQADPPELTDEFNADIASLQAIFARGDGEAAVKAMETVLSAQKLPLAVEIQATNALLGVLIKDRAIPARRLQEIATRFGWYGVPDKLRGPNGFMESRFCQRIDALLWHERIAKRARNPLFWLGQNDAAAARLVSGTGPITLSWIAPPEPQLSKDLATAMIFAPVLDNRFDPRRLQRLAGIAKRAAKLRGYDRVLYYVLWAGAVGSYQISSLLPPAFQAASGLLVALFVFFFVSRFFRRYFRPIVVFGYLLIAILAAIIFSNGAAGP